MFVGIEIGGTKLQLGIGSGDGVLAALWRDTVDPAAGPEGIRRQILTAVPELLQCSGIAREQLQGVGIGFGGPVDDHTRTIIKSHQIEGWDNFPLADWIADVVELPVVLGNDADVAGLAEALFGAGKGLSPIFYITVGSGIGGGLIIDGEIYRGLGRGAAEIGHVLVDQGCYLPLEKVASGWAINERGASLVKRHRHGTLCRLAGGKAANVTAQLVAQAAAEGDEDALELLHDVRGRLGKAICDMIALLCPRRIVIGGGVSLMGEALFFEPLRGVVDALVFRPFAGLTDIVPAALGEEVVVHGALALARRKLTR